MPAKGSHIVCHSREGGNPGLNSKSKIQMTNQCQSSNESLSDLDFGFDLSFGF